MSLNRASEQLGWPKPEVLVSPELQGARALVLAAQQRIVRGMRNAYKGEMDVGLLIPEEAGESTPAPLAIVCAFSNVPSEDALQQAHRLAWNFSRAPVLLTIDPRSVRAWSCSVPPHKEGRLWPDTTAEIGGARINWEDQQNQGEIAASLHWVNLLSGRFFVDNANHFSTEGRLDQTLLGNLKSVRNMLQVPTDIAHDLLGRVIFIQFLFQRTDSSGNAALNGNVLQKLADQGIFERRHDDLASILAHHADAYRFFRWLNEKFNGDLFPGKSPTDVGRESEWHAEMENVRPEQLELLSEFVSGRLRFSNGQRSLFPLYSFDTIPLELISSIYEEFVSAGEATPAGAHYTPAQIVDLLLDGVLPWGNNRWDLKILDPACGSGIFLVKAFQRLIHRWKLAHPNQAPNASDLRQILENNIFGIDINAEAVRVASFSLYLAMCDEIDPRYYWTQVRFPRLRGYTLRASDYFNSSNAEVSAQKFDLILGNAPWGQNTVTAQAERWADLNGWSVSYGTLGPLFLPRATEALVEGGTISMLQPASMLTNSVATAKSFRRRLFASFKVEEVINLSALRFGLFANAVDPACILTMRKSAPDSEFITYICPKPTRSTLDDYRIGIDPQDLKMVSPYEAAANVDVWSALMWGNERDLLLARKLAQFPNFGKLEAQGRVSAREGVIRGDRKKALKGIVGRRMLEGKKGQRLPVQLDPEELPKNEDPWVDSRASTDFTAFDTPQLIIKQGWTKTSGRFEAALVNGDPGAPGVICSQSYISVSSRELSLLQLGRAVYSSAIAVYYLLLTSGRFSSYRPEPTASDLLRVPLPVDSIETAVSHNNLDSIDSLTRDLFGLQEAECDLVTDLISYTLPDFKGDARSPGRMPTPRTYEHSGDLIESYCRSVTRGLKAGFGKDKTVGYTVYEETSEHRLPIRMVMFHFYSRADVSALIRHSTLSPNQLLDELTHLSHNMSSRPRSDATFLRTRVVKSYLTLILEGLPTPSVAIIKPDQARYWTRSAGLRDADELATDVLNWSSAIKREVPAIVQ